MSDEDGIAYAALPDETPIGSPSTVGLPELQVLQAYQSNINRIVAKTGLAILFGLYGGFLKVPEETSAADFINAGVATVAGVLVMRWDVITSLMTPLEARLKEKFAWKFLHFFKFFVAVVEGIALIVVKAQWWMFAFVVTKSFAEEKFAPFLLPAFCFLLNAKGINSLIETHGKPALSDNPDSDEMKLRKGIKSFNTVFAIITIQQGAFVALQIFKLMDDKSVAFTNMLTSFFQVFMSISCAVILKGRLSQAVRSTEMIEGDFGGRSEGVVVVVEDTGGDKDGNASDYAMDDTSQSYNQFEISKDRQLVKIKASASTANNPNRATNTNKTKKKSKTRGEIIDNTDSLQLQVSLVSASASANNSAVTTETGNAEGFYF